MQPRVPETRQNSYYLLRFWRPKDNMVLYARDVSRNGDYRRDWTPDGDLALAYKFRNRSDARSAARAKRFEELNKGPWRSGCRIPGMERKSGHDKSAAYFWEVVKVTETITTTFEEEIAVSNMPAMLQIAREVECAAKT